MSDIIVQVGLPNGTIGSLSLPQLASVLTPFIQAGQGVPIPEVEAGNNISVVNNTNGTSTVSIVDVPTFLGVNLNGTLLTTNQEGQLTEVVGTQPQGALLTQSNVTASGSASVTMTPSGINIDVPVVDTSLSGIVPITDSSTEKAGLLVVDDQGAGTVTTNTVEAIGTNGMIVSMRGNTGEVAFSSPLLPDVSISRNGMGILAENISGLSLPILTSGNLTGTTPIVVTPTLGGSDVSISPNPNFNSVNVGGSVLSTGGGNLLVDINGAGPVPILTQSTLPYKIEPGLNIEMDVNPSNQVIVIGTTPNATFDNLVATSNVALNTQGGVTSTNDLVVNGGANVQNLQVAGLTGLANLTVLGATSTNDLTVNGGAAVNSLFVSNNEVVGGSVIANGGMATSTLTATTNAITPSVILNGTTVTTDINGNLTETIGGNTYEVITEANIGTHVIGGTNIDVVDNAGVVTVSTVTDPSFGTVGVGGSVLSTINSNLLSNGIPQLSQANTIGGANINVTNAGLLTSISTRLDPAFSSLTIVEGATIGGNLAVTSIVTPLIDVGGTLLAAGTGGNLTETIGGNTSFLLSSSNTTGVGPVATITDPVTGDTSIGIRNDPIFFGTVAIADNGLTPASLSVTDNAGLGSVITNNVIAMNSATPAVGVGLDGTTASVAWNSTGLLPTTVSQDTNGQLIERIGSTSASTILTNSNLTATTPIVATPTPTGTDISIVPNPVFNSVSAISSISTPLLQILGPSNVSVTSDPDGNLLENGAFGGTPILTGRNLTGTYPIIVSPTPVNGVDIAISPYPTFNTVTTDSLDVTNSAHVSTLTVDNNVAVGGSVTANGGVTTSTLTATSGVVAPTAVINGTTLAAGTGGNLTETIGGNTSFLLSSSNTTGTAPITVTPVSGTGNTVIGMSEGPTLMGSTSIVDGATQPASLTVINSTNTGTIDANRVIASDTADTSSVTMNGSGANITFTGAGLQPAVLSQNADGFLAESVNGGPTYALLNTGNVTAGINTVVTPSTDGVSVGVSTNPSFTSVQVASSVTVGTANLSSSGPHLTSSDGGTILTTGNVLPVVSYSGFPMVIQSYLLVVTYDGVSSYGVSRITSGLYSNPAGLSISGPVTGTDYAVISLSPAIHPNIGTIVLIDTPVSSGTTTRLEASYNISNEQIYLFGIVNGVTPLPINTSLTIPFTALLQVTIISV